MTNSGSIYRQNVSHNRDNRSACWLGHGWCVWICCWQNDARFFSTYHSLARCRARGFFYFQRSYSWRYSRRRLGMFRSDSSVCFRVEAETMKPNQALQRTPRLRLCWHVGRRWRGVSELGRSANGRRFWSCAKSDVGLRRRNYEYKQCSHRVQS